LCLSLLGEYNYKENEVKISPVNISFEEGNLVQNLN
jgi:ABC-type siderophore export system fused ATPase/permease subunit